jgi:aromatic O-demethylase, cytochrome P450 subunit
MSMSGPEHRDLRNAANAPFRPRAVQMYRDDLLRTTAARYIEAIRDRGRAEATGELLEPISQRAVGDALGFTDVDDSTLARWFHTYADYLVDAGRNPITGERGRAVKAEVAEYLRTRLAGLDRNPDGSALSHMRSDGLDNGRTRSVDDLIGTVGVLIVGGVQEPAHAVANTLLGLLQRPEQAARVADDPAAWSRPALEEGFRWIAPFGMTEKLTTRDVTLGGLVFPAGTEVALVLGSANRDPSRFDDPNVYDLDRTAQANQSFGYGAHFCIGHAVARSLGQVILEEMFTRLPNLRLDPDDEPFVHGWQVRAAKRLPLVWDA